MNLLNEFNIPNQQIVALHPLRPELILFCEASKLLIHFDYVTQKVLNKAVLSNNNYIPISGCFLDEDVILNLPNNFLFINTAVESSENPDSLSN